MSQSHEVVLGTGPLGIAVMKELLKANKKVTMVNRSGKLAFSFGNVDVVKCDVQDQNRLIELCRNASIIYYCLGLPYHLWKAHFPIMMDNVIEAAAQTKAKLVYGDNVYAYGPQKGPLHENLPYNPVGEKTTVRAEVATKLVDAYKAGKVHATIGRGSDFYGPYVRNAVLGERVFQNLLQSRKVELVGNPEALHSHIFIEDFAKGLVRIGQEEKAYGEIWHIPGTVVQSNREIVEIIAEQMKVKPKYRIASPFIVSIGSLFSPLMKELKELMYQHTEDFIVDTSKYQQTFGLEVTPFHESIKKTIQWYQINH